MKESVLSAFADSATVKQQFAREHADRIAQVAKLMADAFRNGSKVLLFGNGGSATDAAHIAAEFVGRYKRDRMPLPAIALATDIAAITCIANDYGYDELFARQVRAHGRKGDIAVAPTGALGFTITTGRPSLASFNTSCSARYFDRL